MTSNAVTDQVWLVTTGSYSDYRVVCAFTTEALAREYKADRNAHKGTFDDDLVVESYQLFDAPVGDRVMLWHGQIFANDDGSVSERDFWSDAYEPWNQELINAPGSLTHYMNSWEDKRWRAVAWHTDREWVDQELARLWAEHSADTISAEAK